MNLHQLAAPYAGAVNPNQRVGVQSNVGSSAAADASVQPAYATPGALAASIGGTFTASIPDPVDNPTTLSVSVVLTGSLQAGDEVSGSDGTNSLPTGTTIIEQLSGPPGAAGTYEISQGAVLNSCTVTSESTVLNVTAVSAGVLQPGQTLADTGALAPGTMITGFISGTEGGIGLYSLSQQQTVAPEAMTTSMTIVAQIQATAGGDLRHMDALNIQGQHKTFYFNGVVTGGVRVALKGGDILTTRDGSIWLVTQPVEPWSMTAGWCKIIATKQNGG